LQGEDFNLSGQNLTWPKVMQRTRRFLKIILGFTLLTIGAAMLLLPGPGWLTIGLGFVVLAAEFIWAQRLLNRLRGAANQAVRACFGRNWSERAVSFVLGRKETPHATENRASQK